MVRWCASVSLKLSILYRIDHNLAVPFIQFIVKYRCQQITINTTGNVTSKEQIDAFSKHLNSGDHTVPHTILSY